jgi:hypothetical protein
METYDVRRGSHTRKTWGALGLGRKEWLEHAREVLDSSADQQVDAFRQPGGRRFAEQGTDVRNHLCCGLGVARDALAWSIARSILGGSADSQRWHAWQSATIAGRGWFTSCAFEADSLDICAARVALASLSDARRSASSAGI